MGECWLQGQKKEEGEDNMERQLIKLGQIQTLIRERLGHRRPREVCSLITQERPASGEEMRRVEQLFGTKHPIIGAVHFSPLPGYEGFGSLEDVYQCAAVDTKALQEGGAHGIIFENNYDTPHKLTDVGKETELAMTELIGRLKQETTLPIGVSVLFNDYRTALRIAKTVGADFIRVPVFVDHVMTNYGEVLGTPEEILAYRREIDAEDVLLFTDIHVKHSTILNQETIEESAQNAISAGSDGLIITGKWTGDAPNTDELKRVRNAVSDFPIFLGSGVDADNISSLFEVANGTIVSTSLKEGDIQEGEINMKGYAQRIKKEKVQRLVEVAQRQPDVLFICQGNIGRSQMAEGFFNELAQGRFVATSAGTIDVAEKYGGHPTKEIVDTMKEKGIDVSPQKIKQVTEDMVKNAKRIVVLCSKDQCPEFVRESTKSVFMYVEDPFGMGVQGTREVRDKVRVVVEGILDTLQQEDNKA